MDNSEIIKALKEVKEELNLSDDDIKEIIELGKILFVNEKEDKGDEK